MNKIFTNLMILIGVFGVGSCAAQDKRGDAEVTLGKAVIAIPAGWTKSNDGPERINISSPDGLEQVTISIMSFDKAPTFADFKRLCLIRLEAEKTDAPDISIKDEPPFDDAGTFGMNYSGKEASSDRLFSGYVTQRGVEVHIIYVEGVGIDPKRHRETLNAFVKGFKRQ
jgi:hypothetical protein